MSKAQPAVPSGALSVEYRLFFHRRVLPVLVVVHPRGRRWRGGGLGRLWRGRGRGRVIRLVGRGCRLSRRRGRGRGRGLGCRAGGLLLVRGAAALAALTGGGELVNVEAVVGEVARAAGRGARGQTIGHGAGEVVPAEVERAEAVQPGEERGGQRARQPVVLELEPRVGVRVRVRVRVRGSACALWPRPGRCPRKPCASKRRSIASASCAPYMPPPRASTRVARCMAAARPGERLGLGLGLRLGLGSGLGLGLGLALGLGGLG